MRPVLERKLSGDIAARGYRSRDLEKLVLERELLGGAEGCTQRRARRRSEEVSWIAFFRNLTPPLKRGRRKRSLNAYGKST